MVAPPTLPIEVLHIILDATYLSPDHTLWPAYARRKRFAWFASTLRVSRAWYIAGRHALYHRIEIDPQDERTITLLIRTLTRRPLIAQMVKVLHVECTAHQSRDVCTSLIPMSSYLYTTEWGRKAQRKNRRNKKLSPLLQFCVGLTQLRIDQPNFTDCMHALNRMSANLERPEIYNADWVTRAQWEHLAQSSFYHNLRSLRFDAGNPDNGSYWHCNLFALEAAFPSVGVFTRLEELEIVGCVELEQLNTILHIAGPTLKTLRCDQLDAQGESGLNIVAGTLHVLVLSVWYLTPIGDLTMFTRLDHLTIDLAYAILSTQWSRSIIFRGLPPHISTFKLQIPELFEPWHAAAYVREVLRAFDLGFLPNLNKLVVSAILNSPQELHEWTPTALLLHGTVQRRGLVFRLDVRLDLRHPSMFNVDCFSRACVKQDNARHIEWRRMAQRRGLGEVVLSTVTCGLF